MGETNSPSVAHVGYDISPLSRVKLKILTTRLTACGYNFKLNSLQWRNIVTHGQLKENLYIHFVYIYASFSSLTASVV
jgi:hypothetical protein